MVALKTILRRAKTLFWTAFSIVVILLAVGMGIGRLLMPYSVHYQPELEQWLSKEFGQPVAIDSFEGSFTAFGPRLTLSGLKLLEDSEEPGGGEAEVIIESAALDIRPLAYLLAGRPLYNFRVVGADFELRRDDTGELRLSGFGVTNRGPGERGSALRELARVGEVALQDSSLEYIDDEFGIRVGLDDIQGRLNLDGDELAIEIRATLYDRRSELPYGEIDATAVLLTDADLMMQAAEWQAQASELMLASFQGKVPANPFWPLTGWLDAEVWGAWSRGSGLRINGVTDLRDALLVNDYQDIHIERASSRFRWRFTGKSRWNLHVADFFLDYGDSSWNTPRLSVARNVNEGVGLWISADELPLGFPLNVVRDVMSVYGREWPSGLPTAADGQVSELELVLSEDWQLSLARGNISGASVSGWERGPDLQGLDGEVDLVDGSGWVVAGGERIGLNWPRMFREPLEVTVPPCRVEVNWGESWQAGFKGCGAGNADAAFEGDLMLRGNERRPSMDLDVAVLRGDVGRLSPYWPEAVMPDTVKSWLRRSLIDGEIVQGRVVIHGDLDHFPFRGHEGRFEAVARIEGLELEYLEGWPVVSQADLVARFEGPGLEVEGTVGESGGTAVELVHATIDDMKAAMLDIEYRTASDLPALLGFMQQTPLQEQINVDLSMFEFAGPASVAGTIRAPLGKTPGELSVDGKVRLAGGRFNDPERDITIDGIHGELVYDERGFSGEALEAAAFGEPARLDIRADADSDEKFRVELNGNFDVRDILTDDDLLEALPMLDRIEGRSDWQVSLSVAPGADSDSNETVLGIRSGLEGVTIGLPAPFDKAPEVNWPFALDYPLKEGGSTLDILLDETSRVLVDLPGENEAPRRVLISLGGLHPELPPEGLFRIEGFAPELDLDGWVSLVVDSIERKSGLGGLELEESRLLAGELLFLDRRYPAVAVGVGVKGDDFSSAFESQDLEGIVRFTAGESGMGSLSAEFERLVLGEPESTGMTMQTDPKDLPALHLYAKSFNWSGLELGEIRIEAFPTAAGMHFEKVDAVSDEISLQATGDWSMAEDGHRSDFRINMASESLGDFLNSMDISSSVQGGQTLVNFDAWWQGTPGQFGLSRLNGKIDFSVIDGNITGADAGPGRLLGLVSFTALPKRLALDFRDVFESGFAFDEAVGTFNLENGIARTDDVLLKSSSASIQVSGETDLVERRYNQLMTVRPGVGNTLPILGALVAGPGGAAAGLAMQGLLQKSLAEATKVSYSITGSWDEPVIEPVEVERAGGS